MNARRRLDDPIMQISRKSPDSALRRYLSADAGASAVEFSMVIAPFMMVVTLLFQVGLYYFGVQSLERVSALASRHVMTGSLAPGSYALTAFRDREICPGLLLALDCDKVVVNAYKVTPSSSVTDGTGIYRFVDATAMVLRSTPTQSSFCVGGPGDYVFLDIAYEFPSVLGSLISIGGLAPKSFMLRSTSFFRNEIFAGQGQTC